MSMLSNNISYEHYVYVTAEVKIIEFLYFLKVYILIDPFPKKITLENYSTNRN